MADYAALREAADKARKGFVREVGKVLRRNGYVAGALHHQGPGVKHYKVSGAGDHNLVVSAHVGASDILEVRAILEAAGYQVHYMSGSIGQWPYLYVLPMVHIVAGAKA